MSFKPLASVLKKLENQQTWQAQKRFWMVLEEWPRVVGAIVTRQTRPISIQREVLRVAVSNATWAHNLSFERQRILEKLNARLSSPLQDIRFSAGDWQTRLSPQSIHQSHAQVLWQDHPSWVPFTTTPVMPTTDDESPEVVFQRWAELMQQRAKHLPICPRCGCPSPTGELERWGVCGLCAIVKS